MVPAPAGGDGARTTTALVLCLWKSDWWVTLGIMQPVPSTTVQASKPAPTQLTVFASVLGTSSRDLERDIPHDSPDPSDRTQEDGSSRPS